MKSNLFIWSSPEVHMNFVWSLNELLMNFQWNEIKFIHINLHAVRMKFIWTSYRRINEVDMLYPCNINEADMRLINSSHEIHMEFIWISNDLNFMWTSCEHKNYMTSTQEDPLYYIWIWFLAPLLCTSYEWASRSIVVLLYTLGMCVMMIILTPYQLLVHRYWERVKPVHCRTACV